MKKSDMWFKGFCPDFRISGKKCTNFLITARGWIVICVVVFITIFICNNQKIAYSEDEKRSVMNIISSMVAGITVDLPVL